MKTEFKILFYLVITIQFSFAQKENVFSKTFNTDKNTSVFIELTGQTLHIENSPDDQIYIDYSVEFNNLSKKRKKEIIEAIKIEANLSDNIVRIKNTPKRRDNFLLRYSGFFNFGLIRYDTILSNYRKKEKDIIADIERIESYKSWYEEHIKERYKDQPEEKEKLLRRHLKRRDRKSHKKIFVIKVPQFINLEILGKGTVLKFDEKITNTISIRLDNGRLFCKSLSNNKNKLRLDNSLLFAKELEGGELILRDVKKALISSAKNIKIDSELSSKIEIGRIGQDVKITDFNSEYLFYNWESNFSTFKLNSEYSKVHFYKPKSDYGFKVFGNNIKLFENDISSELQSNTDGKKYLVTEKKPENAKPSSGQIDFDMVNGIIYSYD